MMDKLTIRDMLHDHIAAVSEIERLTFSTPYSEQFFSNIICRKYACSKVAVLKYPIGYICTDYEAYQSRILTLAVHPLFRRMGVAEYLMHTAMEDLKRRGCVFMELKVRASNIAAQTFYDRFGFRTESVRKHYYAEPDENALLMTARL